MKKNRRYFLLFLLANLSFLLSFVLVFLSNFNGYFVRSRKYIPNFSSLRRFLRFKEKFISKIDRITLDDDAEGNIYGGNSDSKNIFLPLTEKNILRIYDKNTGFYVKDYILESTNKPELVEIIDEGLLIGNGSSSNPVLINKNFRREIIIPSSDFNISSFSKSKDGKVLMGNLRGEPFLFIKNEVKQLRCGCENVYASCWINNDFLLVSCRRENKIRLLKVKGVKAQVIKSIKIKEPYIFSPIYKNSVILTTTVGNLFNIQIKNIGNEIKIRKVEKSYINPLLLTNDYHGYLNDVAWLGYDGGFSVTTRTGGSILVFSKFNKLVQINKVHKSILTRFASSREPSNEQLFVDQFNGSISKIYL